MSQSFGQFRSDLLEMFSCLIEIISVLHLHFCQCANQFSKLLSCCSLTPFFGKDNFDLLPKKWPHFWPVFESESHAKIMAENNMTPEEEIEFKIREEVRLRVESQIQEELKKIKAKVKSNFRHFH